MKKTILATIMLLALSVNNSSTYAQSVVREGKTFKQVSTKNTTTRDTLVTTFLFEDSKGAKYPIIINKSSGRCYIWKKSGKTGKLYKMYMKEEVSRSVSKELNINYKEK